MLSEEEYTLANLREHCIKTMQFSNRNSNVYKEHELILSTIDDNISLKYELEQLKSKANKYDSLVKKIKDAIIDYKKLEKSHRENNNQTMATYMYYQWAVLEELLKEAEDE